MLATERLLRTLGRNRLGELPRACSQLTDYPSRLSKNSRRVLLESGADPLLGSPLASARDDSGDTGGNMELMGIEPVASWLQTRRSPS